MSKYLEASGLAYFWQKIKDALALKVNKYNSVFTGKMSLGRKSGTTEGSGSIALGSNLTAAGNFQHVTGFNNKGDTAGDIEDFVANKQYHKGDIVKRAGTSTVYVFTRDYSGAAIDANYCTQLPEGTLKHVAIVGNGLGSGVNSSNAYTLDWAGNGEFAGDVKADACGGANPISLKNISDSVESLKSTQYIVPVDQIENPTLTTSTAGAVINDALEYASENGFEEVILPPGEYLINETIYLQDNIILKGSGTASTRLKIATGYNIDCIRVDHPVHDAGIKDLTIDGNKIDNYIYFHQQTEHGNAINVWLHRGIIENVRTEYVYKHALLMNYDVGSNTADGLGFDPEDEYRQGNLNKVLHCNFDNSTLEGVMWGWRTMDSWFCYNNIGSNGANLYLEGGTSRFIGNHFDGDGDDGVGPEYNVFCPNGCNTMLFEGNIFENTKKHNIYFQQPSYNADASYGIQIINNIIRTGSKAQDATYNLIEISGYSDGNKNHDIVISGNSLLNPDLNGNQTLYGIHLAYCDDVTIGNNTFFNIAEDNVKIESNCSNIYVDGIDDTAGSGEKQKTWSANRLSALNSALNDKYEKPATGIPASDLASGVIPSVPVTDVQINGTSILNQGVANIPIGDSSNFGVYKVPGSGGLTVASGGLLRVNTASDDNIKAGTNTYRPITPSNQGNSVFYGMATAAGADMASVSGAVVGQYPEAQKKAIRKMLGIPNPYGELIKEVTLAEDATDVEIDTDSNGLPFKLTKMVAVVSAPPSTTGTADNIFGEFMGKVRSTGAINTLSFPAMTYPTATGNMLAKVTINALDGMPVETLSVVAPNDGSSRNMMSMSKDIVMDYLTKFRIYQSGSTKTLIPSGTNVKLYGIRIDE